MLVYTTDTMWTMPLSMWNAVRTDSNDLPMTLTVRGGVYDGTNLTSIAFGSEGTIGIAPVDAPGSIVYWFTNGYNGAIGLNGFSVGDETVVSALTTAQVQEQPITCMGCHAGTPDGLDVVISTSNGDWDNMIANIATGDGGTVGAVPSYAGNAGLAALLNGPLGISSISMSHWTSGDRVVIASNNTDLQWIDVESTNAGTARGTIARNGTQVPGTLAGSPDFSHDGTKIVYTATNHTTDGRLGGYYLSTTTRARAQSLYIVPYNNRAGGTVAPVSGASDPGLQSYYPAFLTRRRHHRLLQRPQRREHVQPASGRGVCDPHRRGTGTRLAANDPPMCTGISSPGVTNSWPKWAPSVGSASNGRSFYWIVFSSTRIGSAPATVRHAGGGHCPA